MSIKKGDPFAYATVQTNEQCYVKVRYNSLTSYTEQWLVNPGDTNIFNLLTPQLSASTPFYLFRVDPSQATNNGQLGLVSSQDTTPLKFGDTIVIGVGASNNQNYLAAFSGPSKCQISQKGTISSWNQVKWVIETPSTFTKQEIRPGQSILISNVFWKNNPNYQVNYYPLYEPPNLVCKQSFGTPISISNCLFQFWPNPRVQYFGDSSLGASCNNGVNNQCLGRVSTNYSSGSTFNENTETLETITNYNSYDANSNTWTFTSFQLKSTQKPFDALNKCCDFYANANPSGPPWTPIQPQVKTFNTKELYIILGILVVVFLVILLLPTSNSK